MKMKYIIYLITLLIMGCTEQVAEQGVDKAVKQAAATKAFQIIVEKDIYLYYETDNPFKISLFSELENRIKEDTHQAGSGKIRMFEDKGAIWLSENGRGYGCITSSHRWPMKLAVSNCIVQDKPVVIGIYLINENTTSKIYLKITTLSTEGDT